MQVLVLRPLPVSVFKQVKDQLISGNVIVLIYRCFHNIIYREIILFRRHKISLFDDDALVSGYLNLRILN